MQRQLRTKLDAQVEGMVALEVTSGLVKTAFGGLDVYGLSVGGTGARRTYDVYTDERISRGRAAEVGAFIRGAQAMRRHDLG